MTLRLAFFLLLASSSCRIGSAEEEFSFPYPLNRIGYSDGAAKVAIWVNGGWGIRLAGGERLPLRFNFSSMQDRIADGILGVGWWVPLCESSVRKRSETVIWLTSLGGTSVYLFADPGVSGSFSSLDGSWSGKQAENEHFLVEGAGGWNYIYKGGRIMEATAPSGSRLEWIYDGSSEIKSLRDETGENLLEIARDLNGRVNSIEVGGSGGRINFFVEWSDYPLINRVFGVESVIGNAEVLSEFGVQTGGRKERLQYSFPITAELGERSGDHGNYMMEIGLPDTGETKVEWDFDGKIISDGGGKYSHEMNEDGYFLVTRELDNGGSESYSYDPQRGVVGRTNRFGHPESYYHILSPGGAYGKLRRTEKIIEGEGRMTTDSYHYSENGEPLRRISHQFGIELWWDQEIKKWTVRSGGRILELRPIGDSGSSDSGSSDLELIGNDGKTLGLCSPEGVLKRLVHGERVYFFEGGNPSRVLRIADEIDWRGAKKYGLSELILAIGSSSSGL